MESIKSALDHEERRMKLLEPYTYVASMPSKNIRNKVATSLNQWFGLEHDKVDKVCQIVTALHNASIIIDDIQDRSDLRRGLPSAHIKYGMPLTLNAANIVVCQVLREVFHLGGKSLVQVTLDRLTSLFEGQGMEVIWREGVLDLEHLPDEEKYEEVIVKKTTGLFMLIVELMEGICNNLEVPDFRHLVTLMGLYFQMRDDYMNLCSKEYEDTKGFCEDISEGKLSFPVIKALKLGEPEKLKRLLDILRMRPDPDDIEVKKEALQILEQCGAISKTKERLLKLQDQIRKEVESFGGNENLSNIFSCVLYID